MEPHHVAWLADHPGRTEEWLRERFADGFHIHHVNGDRSNNSPENLLLVDDSDHSRLHRKIAPVLRAGPGFDRLAYQRNYMRERRAKAKLVGPIVVNSCREKFSPALAGGKTLIEAYAHGGDKPDRGGLGLDDVTKLLMEDRALAHAAKQASAAVTASKAIAALHGHQFDQSSSPQARRPPRKGCSMR